jgi:hypothetical protein
MSAGDDRKPTKPMGTKPDPAVSAKSALDDKAKRQAEALRANLKRRKAQQRNRADPDKAAGGQD